MNRHFVFDGIENFRDLGGYTCRYGTTHFGVLYRSGSLTDASQEDLAKIASMGIKSVIDIRSDKDKEKYPDATKAIEGITHYELSVNGNGRVPVSREDMIDSYLEMLEEPHQARKIFMAIAHVTKPAIIHCVAGKDRTGVFVFLTLLLNGVPFEEANADYLMSPAYLTRLREHTKATNPDFPSAVMDPDANLWPEVWNRFLEKYHSLDEYLDFLAFNESDAWLLKNCLGKQERSFGAVVFNDNGEVLVERMQKGHFSLPKGHVERFDKGPKDTARREILEETGLNIEFLSDKTTSIEYSPAPGIAKKVSFFVAKPAGGALHPQKEEVSEIYWLKPEDAHLCLTHETDRYVLKWAYATYTALS